MKAYQLIFLAMFITLQEIEYPTMPKVSKHLGSSCHRYFGGNRVW